MHVSERARCGGPLSGSIAVLALSALLALLAAPAAGQTALLAIPASADGPVHFSQAGVTRETNSVTNGRALHFLSTTEPAADDVLPVMGRGFGLVAVGIIGTRLGEQYPQYMVRAGCALDLGHRSGRARGGGRGTSRNHAPRDAFESGGKPDPRLLPAEHRLPQQRYMGL